MNGVHPRSSNHVHVTSPLHHHAGRGLGARSTVTVVQRFENSHNGFQACTYYRVEVFGPSVRWSLFSDLVSRKAYYTT